MEPLKSASDDIAARQPVWEALSDMFLDTDTSLSRQCRASQLAQSPYSIEQLEFILVNEVYPICRYNLLSIAGEWTGFNPEWLRSRILRRLQSRFQFLRIRNPGRFTGPASSEWQATRQAIIVNRSAQS
jgi:hypothetical protein